MVRKYRRRKLLSWKIIQGSDTPLPLVALVGVDMAAICMI